MASQLENEYQALFLRLSGADPGFLVGGNANPGGAQTYNFPVGSATVCEQNNIVNSVHVNDWTDEF